MERLKNLKAEVFSGTTGFVLDVSAATQEDVRFNIASPQGFNPMILLLALIKDTDAISEDWKVIHYTENVSKVDRFRQVEVIGFDSVDVINRATSR